MKTSRLFTQLLPIFENMGIAAAALTEQASFTHDLGLDSLDITDLLLQIEQQFNIRIPDEDWFKLTTVGSLMQYIQDKK